MIIKDVLVFIAAIVALLSVTVVLSMCNYIGKVLAIWILFRNHKGGGYDEES